MKMYQFKLQFGDRWNDGHGKYQTTLMESNVEVSELERLYLETSEKTEINLDHICSDYQNCTITLETIEQLGLDVNEWEDTVNDDGEIWLDCDSYEGLYIRYMMTHNPQLKIKWVIEDIKTIELDGGYGLFD